jgi:hypothetical protein
VPHTSPTACNTGVTGCCTIRADLDYSSSEEDSEANGGRVVMAVKSADNFGTAHSDRKNRTLRFRGFIDSKEVLILLDSGSARTFISQEVASLISQP